MTPHETRLPGSPGATDAPPRGVLRPFRRFLLVLGVVLLLGLGAYLLFERWNRNRIKENPALLAELQGARLVDNAERSTLPGDWPQWRGPRRDGLSLETGLNWSWLQDGPHKAWEAPA